MKQRVISSMIGLVILFAVLMLFNTIALNIAIAFISLLAVYELLSATGCWANKLTSLLAMFFAVMIPFFSIQAVAKNLIFICYLYVIAIFVVLLRQHERLPVEKIALSFMFSLMIPFSLSTIIYLRDRWGMTLGIFYALVSLGGAWLSDTGAYFAGLAFGKHKLAPNISPKKTVEGAIGGAIFAAVFMLLVAWLYSLGSAALGYPITVHYITLLCLMPFLSVVSIIGDLSASIVKRQFNVKDYGSIMPGHGGVMDRFDSALMVAPLVYMISQHLPLAQPFVK
ncbi:phosphatidate cytidylyltransferase [Oscillospiraceae bacterium PP1C4]